jgi:O-antigen/teichoic acid export membrane protein
MMVIGGFEVRTVQSTDIKNEYKFQTYFTLRIITCILMMAICGVYAYKSNFDDITSRAVWVFGLYKAVEIFADVFSGVYQQKDRIDLCGKTFTVRALLTSLTFSIILAQTKDLIIAGIAMVVVSVILLFIYDVRLVKIFNDIKIAISFEKIIPLIKAVMPLFISAFIMMYINNAPKYAINKYCTNIEQNKYSILFMPAFVINLFSLFLFRPILVDMAVKWNNYDNKAIISYIKKSMLSIFLISVLCIFGGVLCGIPLLSIVYGVDLYDSKVVFIIIMTYGGFNAIGNYFYYVLTVMRQQSKIMIGYMISFVMIFFLAPLLVKKFSLLGAALSSLLAFGVVDVIMAYIAYRAIRKHKEV